MGWACAAIQIETMTDSAKTSPASLPCIAVLATGGTIAGAADPRSEGGYNAGALSAETLLSAVPGMDRQARIAAEQVAAIGSQDMNEAVWQALVARITTLQAQADVAGIVITHGTDTMEETALLLDLATRGEKPVVMVGAMRPATAVGAEGPRNLQAALQVALAPQARGRGVMVVLNDAIHGARDVTKTSTTAVETFRSLNTGPAGAAIFDSVTFFRPPEARLHLPLPANPLPRVEIVYAYAGADGRPVEAAVAAGAQGIVLAGVGDGNAPAAMMDALAAAARAGVAIVRASRTASGPVVRNIEVDDDRLGFVASGYHAPAKARVLLQLLLANGHRDVTVLQAVFRNHALPG